MSMPRWKLAAFVPVVSLAFAFAAEARADVPPPNTQSCQGKNAGAACETDDKKPGACATQKCSRLDYSKGTPPGTVQYDCQVCVASDGNASSGSTGGSSASGGSTSAPSKSGCALAPGRAGAPGAALAVAGVALGLVAAKRARRREGAR